MHIGPAAPGEILSIHDSHPPSLHLAHSASLTHFEEKTTMSARSFDPSREGQEQHAPTVLRAPRLRVKDLPDEDEPSSYEFEQAAIGDQMDVDTEQATPAGDSNDAMDVDGPSCSWSATNGPDPRCTAHRSSGTSNGKSAANAQAMPTRRMSAAVPRSPVPSVISMLDQSVDLKCPFLSPTAPTPSGLFYDTSKKSKD